MRRHVIAACMIAVCGISFHDIWGQSHDNLNARASRYERHIAPLHDTPISIYERIYESEAWLYPREKRILWLLSLGFFLIPYLPRETSLTNDSTHVYAYTCFATLGMSYILASAMRRGTIKRPSYVSRRSVHLKQLPCGQYKITCPPDISPQSRGIYTQLTKMLLSRDMIHVQNPDQMGVCAICQKRAFSHRKQDPACTLQCGHTPFHMSCMHEYVEGTSPHKQRCPFCQEHIRYAITWQSTQ